MLRFACPGLILRLRTVIFEALSLVVAAAGWGAVASDPVWPVIDMSSWASSWKAAGLVMDEATMGGGNLVMSGCGVEAGLPGNDFIVPCREKTLRKGT